MQRKCKFYFERTKEFICGKTEYKAKTKFDRQNSLLQIILKLNDYALLEVYTKTDTNNTLVATFHVVNLL